MSFGVSAALATPFVEDGSLDVDRLAAHAAGLLERGLAGVTPFGTTGEGASVGAAERLAALDAFVAAGLPMARVTLGLAACAVDDALDQARAARERGVGAVLVPPPFYFPDPDPAAVHDWYATLIGALPDGLAVVLYHIPQVTGVALDPDTVARLHGAHPERVRAIKDSSGDAATARALLALDGPEVLIGDERLLGPLAAEGVAGAISGMANLHPERLLAVFGEARSDPALDAAVDAAVPYPVVPAIKALMAEREGEAWARVRPPLRALDGSARASLVEAVARAGAG